jgi:hypothetical protein
MKKKNRSRVAIKKANHEIAEHVVDDPAFLAIAKGYVELWHGANQPRRIEFSVFDEVSKQEVWLSIQPRTRPGWIIAHLREALQLIAKNTREPQIKQICEGYLKMAGEGD